MNSYSGYTGIVGVTGVTGVQKITGPSSGITGPVGIMGIQGITGLAGSLVQTADLEPEKCLEFKRTYRRGIPSETKKVIRYKSKNDSWVYHCPFGPADLDINIWIINGITLNDKEIEMAKQILDDVTIAPLYLNDPILSYPARWVLKYGSEKRDVDELIDKTIAPC